MGKLSKAKQITDTEKYCIQGMHYNEMSEEEISKALGRDIEEVASYISVLEQEQEKKASNFIINETGSGNKGVSVMTQAGSERVDAARERLVPPARNTNTIHSIHD